MKTTDVQIIKELRRNAKVSLSQISKKMDMPISTIYDRITKFQNLNLIKKAITILDYNQLGYNHHHKILIKTNKKLNSSLIEFLKNDLSVNSAFKIEGKFNFLVETFHKDFKDYLKFQDKLINSFDAKIQEFPVTAEIIKEELMC